MRPFVVVVVAATCLLSAACGSFGAETAAAGSDASAPDGGVADASSGDASVCAADSCEGKGPSCRAYDFDGAPCLPRDWSYGGDETGVVKECAAGKLHLAAEGTLDAVAGVEIAAPMTSFAARISFRAAVKTWDGERVVGMWLGGSELGELRAEQAPSGRIRYTVCAANACSPKVFEAAPGAEHLFAFDFTPAGTSTSIDCEPFVTSPRAQLETNTTLSLSFGHTDGNPIDGTLDDVTVSFRDP